MFTYYCVFVCGSVFISCLFVFVVFCVLSLDDALCSFFLLCLENNPKESKTNKYKNWEVNQIGDLILYRTHGNIVHGHSLGWIKRKGQCNYDNLYLTYSSSHKDKDILEKLKNNKIYILLKQIIIFLFS